MTVGPGDVGSDAADDFIIRSRRGLGARREIIERARFALLQSIDTLVGGGIASGPVQIEASVRRVQPAPRVSYEGPALEFPRTQLTADEILSSEEGERRLCRLPVTHVGRSGERRAEERATTMRFDFDH